MIASSLAPQERSSAGENLGLAAFFCFVFWDVYFSAQGVRPLDLAGSVLLAVGLFAPEVRHARGDVSGVFLPLITLGVVGAAVAGVWVNTVNVRAAIGVCTGVMAFGLFCFWPITRAGVLRITKVALVVNLAGFWLQFVYYYATGSVLNYYGVLGAHPRVFAPVFRAAGLYLEPAHFALMSFSLLALRVYVSKRLDSIAWMTIIAMVASLSLWGVITSAVLLVMQSAGRWRRLVLLASIGVAAGVALIITGFWKDLFVLNRLSHLGTDPSANVRYGALMHFSSSDVWRSSFWIGHGVQRNYMELGANSLSYLLTSAGILGAAALTVGLTIRVRRGAPLFFLATFLLMLTAAYLWTFMYWWAWLALLCRTDLRHPRAALARTAAADADAFRAVGASRAG